MHCALVVSDIDGTLLNSEGRLSCDTRRALEGWRKRGGLFTLATGRSEEEARPIINALGVDQPVVLYNGGVVADPCSGRRLYQAAFGQDVARLAARLAEQQGWPFVAYSLDGRAVAGMVPAGALLKIVFQVQPASLMDAVRQARQVLAGRATVVASAENAVEVLPAGVSKGQGLAVLARFLGVPLPSTLAVGNFFNDIPMLKRAGLGVAVANAPQEVRAAAAGWAPSNDEDGVAWAVRQYCLAPALPAATVWAPPLRPAARPAEL